MDDATRSRDKINLGNLVNIQNSDDSYAIIDNAYRYTFCLLVTNLSTDSLEYI